MLVVKSILMMCLFKYGYNMQYARTLQDIDYRVSTCIDTVTECYYSSDKERHGDVFECLKKDKQRQ
jgi:hypothetical protein